MPSPLESTTSNSVLMPCTSSSTGLAGSPSRITPVFHSVLPSPATLNEMEALELPAPSSTPTKAENRCAPPFRLILVVLSACVPRPCSNLLPATERGLPVMDLSACALPQPVETLEISRDDSQRVSEPRIDDVVKICATITAQRVMASFIKSIIQQSARAIGPVAEGGSYAGIPRRQ